MRRPKVTDSKLSKHDFALHFGQCFTYRPTDLIFPTEFPKEQAAVLPDVCYDAGIKVACMSDCSLTVEVLTGEVLTEVLVWRSWQVPSGGSQLVSLPPGAGACRQPAADPSQPRAASLRQGPAGKAIRIPSELFYEKDVYSVALTVT